MKYDSPTMKALLSIFFFGVRSFESPQSSRPIARNLLVRLPVSSSSAANFGWADEAESQDLDQIQVERQERRRIQRRNAGRFRWQLSLQSKRTGIVLAQIDPGKQLRTDFELNLSTLEIRRTESPETEQDLSLTQIVRSQLSSDFQGLIVRSVEEGSTAWKQGIRAGDVLHAVSATLGNSLWPKTTLNGIQSALQSRKVASSWAVIEFERLGSTSRQLFELSLTRPLGFQIKESNDGYIVVSAINGKASKLVRKGLQVGDRLVAVDSSLGGKLWPVSSVEGVISACTSRLPGQKIRLQFERVTATVEVDSTDETSEETIVKTPAQTEVSVDDKDLIKRCRGVLDRYSNAKRASTGSKLDSVPALVADKVVDSLASSSVRIDAVTLSMIMKAYVSSGNDDNAISIFEAVTGFKGDGSIDDISTIIQNEEGSRQIIPNEAALNLVTGTILLQVQSQKGDLNAVKRIFAAIQGQSGEVIGGKESAPWPWTGRLGTIVPDTKLYNVALAAAEKIKGPEALQFAQELYEQMRDPDSLETSLAPQSVRDIVTMNTYISILAQSHRQEEAFNVYNKAARLSMIPDRFTFNSLLKACSSQSEWKRVFVEMKKYGVKPDVFTYNAIIKSLCAMRKLTEASRLIVDMESKGISPDSMTYSFLMTAMLRKKKPEACLTLFESACTNDRSQKLIHNVHLYTTAITAASMIKDYERALDLLSRMTAQGIKPNLKTLTAVVGACLICKKYDLAARVFRRIENPDSYAYAQGIEALIGNGEIEEARDLLTQGHLTGKQMMSTYAQLLSFTLSSKMYDTARSILGDMLRTGFIPSNDIFNTIVDVFEIKLVSIVYPTDDDKSRFRFLLSVMDMLSDRQLPVNGNFYASALVLGRQIGGPAQSVCELLTRAKTKPGSTKEDLFSDNHDLSAGLDMDWEDLLELPSSSDAPRIHQLPVRIASHEAKRVFRAEQSILSMESRKQKQLKR